MNDQCLEKAIEVRDALAAVQGKIVLVESCTAGRVAATLASLPGISQWLCGSFVVYRSDSKIRWLGIPVELLDDPKLGPVSQECSQLLAIAALNVTPEARFGLSVTGDVGPGAPTTTDGKIFIAFHDRQGKILAHSVHLSNPAPQSLNSIHERVERLNEATWVVLNNALHWIVACTAKDPHA